MFKTSSRYPMGLIVGALFTLTGKSLAADVTELSGNDAMTQDWIQSEAACAASVFDQGTSSIEFVTVNDQVEGSGFEYPDAIYCFVST